MYLEDSPKYEDRVRQLLAHLEKKTNEHIDELNDVHDKYRNMGVENK